jgi:hypothetical protein
VTTAHETSDAFSDETLREQAIFQFAKESEMKEMLGNLADGQIEFYKSVSFPHCPFPRSLCLIAGDAQGHGGMGANHTSHRKHPR